MGNNIHHVKPIRISTREYARGVAYKQLVAEFIASVHRPRSNGRPFLKRL